MHIGNAMPTELLVMEIGGEARTSTETIAQGVEIRHKDVLALTRKYLILLKEFGLVAFQTRARRKGQHGGGDVEFAWLNERQSAFLISLMRNTEKVVAFKFALVKRFFEMAAKLAQRAEITVRREFLLQIESASLDHSRPFGSGLARRGKEKRAIESELSQLDIQLKLFN